MSLEKEGFSFTALNFMMESARRRVRTSVIPVWAVLDEIRASRWSTTLTFMSYEHGIIKKPSDLHVRMEKLMRLLGFPKEEALDSPIKVKQISGAPTGRVRYVATATWGEKQLTLRLIADIIKL